ncbi:MAG: AI-2E family transporter, partial [Peribacillus sp.]
MFKAKLHFWTLELLLLSVLFYVGTKISFLFEPIVIFTSTLFFPILISGFLYFLFNPTVDLLVKRRVPRGLAILLLYVIFLGLVSLLVGLVGPSLSRQVTDLINNLPDYFNQSRTFIEDLSKSRWFMWTMEQDYVSLKEVGDSLQRYLTDLPGNITKSLSS